jgi:RNA polymerase sigma factor (sigma-70 family)
MAGWSIDDQEKYLRAVSLKMARRCRSQVVDENDFAQVGRLAITQAAARYDPNSTASFKTFAKYRVHGAMIDLLRENDWVARLARQRGEAAPSMLALEVLDEDGTTRERMAATAEREAFERADSETRIAEMIDYLVTGLTVRQGHIVVERFVHGLTFERIARRLGLTESRVCQIMEEIRPALENRARMYGRSA